MAYKTLEQQIQELWHSRGLEVIEEKFKALEDGTFEWTIRARNIFTRIPPKDLHKSGSLVMRNET